LSGPSRLVERQQSARTKCMCIPSMHLLVFLSALSSQLGLAGAHLGSAHRRDESSQSLRDDVDVRRAWPCGTCAPSGEADSISFF
jgi:hypothetical protein